MNFFFFQIYLYIYKEQSFFFNTYFYFFFFYYYCCSFFIIVHSFIFPNIFILVKKKSVPLFLLFNQIFIIYSLE